jgi:hypothetical protein
METVEVVRQLLELGWPGLVTIFLIVLYRDYKSLLSRQVDIYEKLDGIASMLREIAALHKAEKERAQR